MDKRLAKRHKRQVERGREKVRVSEPDLRTPEEKEAAREVSRPVSRQAGPGTSYAKPSGHSDGPAQRGGAGSTGDL